MKGTGSFIGIALAGTAGRRRLSQRMRAQGSLAPAVSALLHDYGCEYDPARDGIGYRDWLRSVRARPG
jgi:hypothetical protein